MALEPLFDQLPPEGACIVRLRTLFARKGGSPVVTCDRLSMEAVQEAIDGSASLAKYLEAMPQKDREALGPAPYLLKAELTYLGMDGQPIDEPRTVDFLYYGKGAAVGAVDPLALLKTVLEQQEQTRRAEALARSAEHQATINALTQHFPTILQQAAQQAAGIAAAASAPLAKAVEELAKARQEDHQRANDATKDVATLLQRSAQKPAVPWSEHFKNLAPWVPIAKDFLGNN